MMEIKATDNSHLNSHAIKKSEDIINKLEASLFRAIISAKTGNQTFSLQTALGKLPISSDLALNIGDELILSVKKASQGQSTELSVSKIIQKNQATESNTFNTTQKISNKPLNIEIDRFIQNFPKAKTHFVAQVSQTSPQKISLTTPDEVQFSIKPEVLAGGLVHLKKTDFVIFSQKTPNTVDMQPISKQALLHEIQKQLLPKQTNESEPYKVLVRAASKLFSSISFTPKQSSNLKNNEPLSSGDKLSSLAKNLLTTNTQLSSNPKINLTALVNSEHTKPNQNSITQETKTPQVIKVNNAIQQIVQPGQTKLRQLIDIVSGQSNVASSISSSQIKQWLSQLSFFHSASQNSSQNQNYLGLFTRLNESLEIAIKELNLPYKAQKNVAEADTIEQIKSLLQETKQPIEQLVHKILFQSANNKLVQETQQTVLINTQIPVTIDKQTKDINLKIKQHNQSQQEQADDVWEIQLSFEFGLLGLISTKIFVKNNLNVIVNFCAERIETQQLLSQKQPVFKQQILNAGLVLEAFHTYHGSPPFDNTVISNTQQKSFIDIKV